MNSKQFNERIFDFPNYGPKAKQKKLQSRSLCCLSVHILKSVLKQICPCLIFSDCRENIFIKCTHLSWSHCKCVFNQIHKLVEKCYFFIFNFVQCLQLCFYVSSCFCVTSTCSVSVLHLVFCAISICLQVRALVKEAKGLNGTPCSTVSVTRNSMQFMDVFLGCLTWKCECTWNRRMRLFCWLIR